jgi:hypothetical protein
MSVLTLAGKPIDWANPPSPTARVMWSQRTTGGRPVIGSLRTIAFIDHLSTLAIKKYRVGISVIQPPFNTGVEDSEGTHDFDACFDWTIVGVPPNEVQKFGRANGMANWERKPPLFTPHQHGFPLPPQEGRARNDDFAVGGFKVGKYVDGGISLYGRQIASSQLVDYYQHRTGRTGPGCLVTSPTTRGSRPTSVTRSSRCPATSLDSRWRQPRVRKQSPTSSRTPRWHVWAVRPVVSCGRGGKPQYATRAP